jgi:hypothetical protein
MSSLGDFSMLIVDHEDPAKVGQTEDAELKEIEISTEAPLPQSSLIIVAETDKLNEDPKQESAKGHHLVASLSDFDFTFNKLKVKDWDPDGGKGYSDFIKEGLEYNKIKLEDYEKIIMLFESPSSSTDAASFHNKGKSFSHYLVSSTDSWRVVTAVIFDFGRALKRKHCLRKRHNIMVVFALYPASLTSIFDFSLPHARRTLTLLRSRQVQVS